MTHTDSGRSITDDTQRAQSLLQGQTSTEQAANFVRIETLLNKLTTNPSLLTVQESRFLLEPGIITRTKYHKLAPGEFRTLAVYPGEGDEILRCRIIPQSLDDIEKPYAALSYTWGDLKDTAWLLCLSADPKATSPIPELGRVQVTRNLVVALKQLRLKNSTISMWVDAICINQEDVQERDRQLPLMAEIYNKASMTQIWLGEASDTSDFGMDLIQQSFDAPVIDPVSGATAIMTRLNDETAAAHQKGWAGLWDILHRPWFQRVWVRQEVAFSPNPLILCGTKVLTWRVFEAATTSMLKANAAFADTLDPLSGLHHTAAMNMLRIFMTNEERENPDMGLIDEILVIISMCRECKASISKDKVLAVVGLCSITPRKHLGRLGFSVTAERIFERVAVVSLLLYNSLKFLSHAGMTSGPKSELNLPSWIPDWSIPWNVEVIDSAQPDHGYRTAGNTKPKFKYDIKQKHLLTLTGKIIDTIESITSETPDFIHIFQNDTIFTTADPEKQEIHNWIQNIKDLTSKHTHSPINSTTTTEESLWRTLIADKKKPYKSPLDPPTLNSLPPSQNQSINHHLRAPSTYLPSYQSWTQLHHQSTSSLPEIYHLEQQSLDFQTAMARSMRNRRFAVTLTKNFFLIGSEEMRRGDLVVVFYGGCVPFVLREQGVGNGIDGYGNKDGGGGDEDEDEDNDGEGNKKGKNKRYKLVGECYVNGLMDGEAFDDDDDDKSEDVEFILE